MLLYKVEADEVYTQLSDITLGQDNYKILKEIAHLALLVPSLTKLLHQPTQVREATVRIKSAYEILGEVLANLSTLNLPLKQICVLCQIATLSLDVLTSLLTAKPDTIDQLQEIYLRNVMPLVSKTMKWAAHEHLRRLDHEVQQLAEQHRIDWQRTRAMLVVAHQPNDDLIEATYFKNLFAAHTQLSPNEMVDNYVYSVECPPPLFGQIDIVKTLLQDGLAKYEMDKVIGTTVFADPNAIFKDILAREATDTLDDLASQGGCPLRKKP